MRLRPRIDKRQPTIEAFRHHSIERNRVMNYLTLLLLHLFAAIIFVGTVFFEVMMLEGIRRHVPRDAMRSVESAVGKRARRVMPWIILVLYGAGLSMAWQYRGVLAAP